MNKKKIIITGGGTGGHVFPALTIASELKRRGFELLYIGSDRGFEARLAPEHGVPFISVKTGAIKNQSLFTKFRTLVRLFSATLWAMRILKREKAAAVVGVGGYVSVPVCLAAFLLRRPIFLQEQNASVGIANRFLGKLCRTVFLGFAEGEQYFPSGRSIITGNPIRAGFSPIGDEPFQADKISLLILGGSQGAKAINDAILANLARMNASHIVHQTGEKDFERVRDAYRQAGYAKVEVSPFIKDMAKAYRDATLVVSRSGALTVSELIQVGRPAIFVPYPRRGQNDQTENAYMLERAGAAAVVEQGEGFNERFWTCYCEVANPTRLASMAENYSGLRRPDAIGTIGAHIESVLSATAADEE